MVDKFYSVLISHEFIDYRNRICIPCVICNVDFEILYMDDWGFHSHMLDRMGFGCKWQACFQCCVSFVKFSILLNQCPKGFFQSCWVLHQGDP